MSIDPAMLQAYAAFGGVAVAFVGLVFVIFQLKGLEQSVRIGAHTAMYGLATAFRTHLVDYPHLRRYFFDSVRIETDHPDYERALTIADLYLNYLEHIAVTIDSFGEGNRTSLDEFIKVALNRSPILAQRLTDDPAYYSPSLSRYLD